MIGSFAACPCHLPLTLAALTAVLGGTAAGALLRDHVVLAGAVVTGVWLLGTARGVWLLRRPKTCPVPGSGARVAQPRDTRDAREAPDGGPVRVARILQDTLRR
ncbi:hypothetical protein ACQP2F_13645 [Actinoplanes sp. CA-030573]|uniref:hypothetical protein n=1 Tax=Actinoplanes sp. CA-030573 TaxID=3239898 RepID=UPI003D938096